MVNATKAVANVPIESFSVEAAHDEFAAWLASSPEEVARANRKLQGILDRESIRFAAQRLPATIKPYCVSASRERQAGLDSETTLAALAALGELLCRDDDALALMGFGDAARALLRLE